MTDHLKGLLITFTGVLFILPDSLFVRLIGTDGVTVAFWKALLIGLVLGLGLLVTRGPGVYRATFAASPLVWVYAATSGASGALFVIAVAHTSIANVVFIVAAMPWPRRCSRALHWARRSPAHGAHHGRGPGRHRADRLRLGRDRRRLAQRAT